MNPNNAITLYGFGVQTPFLQNNDILQSVITRIHQTVNSTMLKSPTIQQTTTGKTIFSASSTLQVTFTTFAQNGSFLMQFYSDQNVDFAVLRQKIGATLAISPGNISMQGAQQTMQFECQEPECTSNASEMWHGRRVCQDHLEQYQAKKTKDIQSNAHWN